ncbi:MAG: MATE family efflux transporter [Akkermansia sp.]
MSDSHPLERSMDWRTLLRFTLPNIAILIAHSSYTIVDGIFVSRFVGALALSSLNMVYPLIGLIFGVAFMIAIGGGALVARLQGEGRLHRSRGIFTMLAMVAFGIALLFAGLGTLFIDPLVELCGCTAAQHELSRTYLLINLWFAPAFVMQMFCQIFFTASGRPTFGFLASLMAGSTNIALDYLFIAQWGWGLAGAAYATGIGASVPAVFGVCYFWLRRSSVIRFTRPIWSLRDFGQACGNGSSEMVTSLASSLITYLFNYNFLLFLGEDGVAAISIALYFQFFFTGIFYGFSEGTAPLVSYQFGRRNAIKLRQALRSSFKILASMGILSLSISLLSLDTLLPIFIEPSEHTYDIAHAGFPIFAIAFSYMWFSVFGAAFFTALGNGRVSASIALGRNLILAIVIITLPQLIGVKGLWMCLPVAEALALFLTLYYLRKNRKNYSY